MSLLLAPARSAMRSIRAPASPYSANSSVAACNSSALVASESRGRRLRSAVGSAMRFTLSSVSRTDDRGQLVQPPRATDGPLDHLVRLVAQCIDRSAEQLHVDELQRLQVMHVRRRDRGPDRLQRETARRPGAQYVEQRLDRQLQCLRQMYHLEDILVVHHHQGVVEQLAVLTRSGRADVDDLL